LALANFGVIWYSRAHVKLEMGRRADSSTVAALIRPSHVVAISLLRRTHPGR
jgi:hypothetical protein